MNSNMKLNKSGIEDHSVLVTGASGALGTSVVQFLKKTNPNLRVIAVDRSGANQSLADEFYGVDLTQADQVAELISSVEQKCGPISSLIHCAGGFRYAPVEQTSLEDIEFLMNLNFKSSFYLFKELLPLMKKRNFGRIVCVGAKAALSGAESVSAYTASKGALHQLVLSTALEVSAFDILVNAICPSIIDTEANRKAMPDADFSQWVPLPELAKIACDLCSAELKSINGALIPVCGKVK